MLPRLIIIRCSIRRRDPKKLNQFRRIPFIFGEEDSSESKTPKEEEKEGKY